MGLIGDDGAKIKLGLVLIVKNLHWPQNIGIGLKPPSQSDPCLSGA